MLADFDDACGKIGLQLNLTKTMFMRNGWVPNAPFSLNGTSMPECSSYVYIGREVKMMNDFAPELDRRKRGAWGAYKSIENVVKRLWEPGRYLSRMKPRSASSNALSSG
ncbi:hypothetical protein Y032_0006g3006 [Ancylostoma ceylanicum]|nr:hypothetical protein Y032_0006g3006 [Ancylostoma ceylanicum]